eukprot:m.242594 g.242594  ORF g.242594 m.242594 type:complete len:441 (+) comp25910_c0_seq1:138-1460(+)
MAEREAGPAEDDHLKDGEDYVTDEEEEDFIDGEDYESEEESAPQEEATAAGAASQTQSEYAPDAAAIAASKEQIQAVEQSLTHGRVRAKRSSGSGQGYMLRYILHGPKPSHREPRKMSVHGHGVERVAASMRHGNSLEALPIKSSPLAPRRSAPPLSEIKVRSNDRLVPLQEALLASMAEKHAEEMRKIDYVKEPRVGNIEIGRHNTILRRTGAIKAVENDLRRPSIDASMMRGTAQHRESIAEIERILKQEGKSDPDTGGSTDPAAPTDRARASSSAPSPSMSQGRSPSLPRLALGELVRDTRKLLLQQAQAASEVDPDQRTNDAIARYFELFCEPGSDTIAAEDVRQHMLAFMPTPFSQEELMILWGKDLPRDRLTLETFSDLCLLHGLESIPSLVDGAGTMGTRGSSGRRRGDSLLSGMSRTFSERDLLVDPVQSSV